MGGLWPAPSPAGDGSAKDGAPLILLAEPGSGIERALVKRWLQEAGVRPSAVFPLDGPGLERSLAGASPDTVITAARVAWLPRERDGERRVRWADVLSQVNPRRPPMFWQRAIMRREPGRAQMVVAEPATVAALASAALRSRLRRSANSGGNECGVPGASAASRAPVSHTAMAAMVAGTAISGDHRHELDPIEHRRR
jgi:hypothetical protein